MQRRGLAGLAAALLDASGPLAFLGAQAIYVGQPFLNQLVPDAQVKALAELLEDPQEIHSFAKLLREE